MKKYLKIIGHLIIVVLLTILTQVGGLVYAVTYFLSRYIITKKGIKTKTRILKLLLFMMLYLFGTFIITPLVAPIFGRVALPLRGNLHPLNHITCILNRHYVKPELKTLATTAANEMKLVDPTSELYYLDANFPFFNGFPLFPHLSHNDGRKLDLALYFKKDGQPVDYARTAIGYGGCVLPYKEEANMPHDCRLRGFWQYNLLNDFLPGFLENEVEFDESRTKRLVELLLKQPKLEKLFLEPHLVNRMGLSHPKIRYHGCQSVRHDDHIHVQIK